MREIKQHSASNLVNVLQKVTGQYETAIKKRYFRSLRISSWEKKVDALHVRKRIKNYVRLCKSIRCAHKNVTLYHKWKVQKLHFDLWFCHLYNMNSLRTIEMIFFCKKMKRKISAYDQLLEHHGVVASKPIPFEVLNPTTSSLRAFF